MIWEYQDSLQDKPFHLEQKGLYDRFETNKRNLDYYTTESSTPVNCKYCPSNLEVLGTKIGPGFEDRTKVSVYFCPCCGGWVVRCLGDLIGVPEGFIYFAKVQGSLKNLDLSDISIPTNELRQYLLAKYDSRFYLNPKKFEDIVANIFSDFGYYSRVLSFSGDKGIDVVVFDGAANDIVGIQVKRYKYKRKIEAEQIRAFAGAMVLQNITRGIYITTSSFRRGARQTANVFQQKGIYIELLDGKEFYNRLKLSQRHPYSGVEDASAPFFPFWQDPHKIPTIVQDSW